MGNSFYTAFLFLITTIFDLYLFLLVVRFILAFERFYYHDPLTQFITKLTNPVVKPIQQYIKNIRRFETATFICIMLLELIKFSLVSLLSGRYPYPLGLLILACGDFLKLLLQTFFYAILIQVILSWIQPFSPFNRSLIDFNAPIMRPIQRIIPPIGGIDISPIPALLLLQFLLMILANPLMVWGVQLTFG